MRVAVLAVLLCLVGAPRPVHADALGGVESEFETAIRKVSPATVVVVARVQESPKVQLIPSSGVIVSSKGLVLSDRDAGVYFTREPKQKPERHVTDDIEIRIPDLKGRGFRSYDARVVIRQPELDTSLIEILDPKGSMPYVSVGDSDELRVGDFAFAMGNSFGLAAEAPPTLTAGLIASLVPFATGGDGRFEWIYTSAAVNQGVNGGPLVDVEGRLVGVISGPVSPFDDATKSADQPYQFLGRVVPIERLRAFYAKTSAGQALFTDKSDARPRSRKAAVLETVFHHTGRRAYRAVVSLEIEREKPFDKLVVPGQRGLQRMWRHSGPVSGIVVSKQGHILTSLYNLGNVALLVRPAQRPVPPELHLADGMKSIKKITAFMPDGRAEEVELVGRHEGLGVALLAPKAVEGEQDARDYAVSVLPPVDADFYETGRFVLAVGNPFGARRLPDPLLAFGVLSKQHLATASDRWAGQWQTDASVTDATCGGAAVDLEGRLIGMLHLWYPGHHGRNSGIGFVVPWSQIAPVLDELKAGRVFALPLIGVTWEVTGDGLEVKGVAAGGAAATAGVKKGDRVLRLDGVEITTLQDAVLQLRGKWSGDRLVLTVRRGDERLDLEVTLGARE
jgi:S1-C subfamily serine protease